MAALSDALLTVTVLLYLAAMIAHAAEYSFGRRPTRQAALAGVAAGGGAVGETATSASPEPARPARDWWAWARGGPLGAIAASLVFLAATVHLVTMVTRGIAAERIPLGNMYEYALTGTFIAVAAWLVVLVSRPTLRHLGLYVAMVIAIVLGLVRLVAYTPVGPLSAPLDSYWFFIHVGSAVVAFGAFLTGFVTAAMYLVRAGHEEGKSRFPYPLGARVPAAEGLERLTFKLHAFAFPIWTFAIISGAIWAEASWGRYWGWDPKEVWAFIAWVIYAAYLHARATPSVRRWIVIWLAIAGFAAMLMNLIGVNLFFSNSLHSYA